jgi:hypothetical protein
MIARLVTACLVSTGVVHGGREHVSILHIECGMALRAHWQRGALGNGAALDSHARRSMAWGEGELARRR